MRLLSGQQSAVRITCPDAKTVYLVHLPSKLALASVGKMADPENLLVSPDTFHAFYGEYQVVVDIESLAVLGGHFPPRV